MKAKDKIVHEGKAYYTVAATARLLATTAAKVREKMGRGELEWVQLQTNGQLYISAESIVSYEKRK